MAIPILRTSERRAFKNCQQWWYWEYQDGLRLRGQHRANALWFGIGMHIVMQERYKYKGLRRGANPLKVWRDYINDEVAYVRTLPVSNRVDEEPVWVDAGKLGEAMIGGYLDYYGKDPRWYVVATEQEFAATIMRPGVKKGPLVQFMSRLDLVARDENSDHGDLYIWDHKNLNAIKTRHLWNDDQMGSYWALAPEALVASGVLKKPEPLTGILYNILRKAMPDPRPRNAEGACLNKDGNVSKVQPAPLFVRELITRTRRERNIQVQHIQAEAVQMQWLKEHPSLITKSPGDQCGWCPFNDMCSLHESGDDWQELRDAMYSAVDPYADYRPSASE